MTKLMGLWIVVVAVVASSTAARAQQELIDLRQRVMDVNAAVVTLTTAMIESSVPFDVEVARAALRSLAHDLEVFPLYFPPGSDKGETKAAPAIWSDMDGFKAAAAKLAADASAAADTLATLDDLVIAMVGTISSDCGSCHAKYRLP
jgi:cytochrome c556